MIKKSIISPPKSGSLVYLLNNFGEGVDVKNSRYSSAKLVAQTLYNFSHASGSLKNSYGFDGGFLRSIGASNAGVLDFGLVGEVCLAWLFSSSNEQGEEQNILVVLNSLLQIYTLKLNQEQETWRAWDLEFTSVPEVAMFNLNGEDVMIFTSPTDSMQVFDGVNAPITVADAPKFSSCVIHGERLFALTQDTKTLWFSDDLDPTSWNISLEDAGFIQMMDSRGALRKVISWNGYLYIFRDYGISRLTATGSQETFALTHLFLSSGKINVSSVCVCGDRILFLAGDGLYAFDGDSTTEILQKISPVITSEENSNAVACFCEGKYFLSCRMKFDGDAFAESEDFLEDESLNNALLIVDATSLEYEIVRGVCVKSFCVMASGLLNKLLVVAKRVNDENQNFSLFLVDRSGVFGGEPLKKVWVSNKSFLGKPHKQKTLKKLSVFSNVSFNLYIKTENDEIKLKICGALRQQDYTVAITGRLFYFKIECQNAQNNLEIAEIVCRFAVNDN